MQMRWSSKKDPGVAKFGIALEWGSRGLEFESQHSDQSEYRFGTPIFYALKSCGMYFVLFYVLHNVGAADPCGPFVWGNTMCCNVVPLGRFRAAGGCGPYEVMKK